MSEYKFVEKPFLAQLESLGWQVLDQGFGVPTDPEKSFRTDFKEVLLKDVFKHSVKTINQTDIGQEWLTDRQLEELYTEITSFGMKGLLPANKDFFELLTKNRSTVDTNELTGEESPRITLIDFHQPHRNDFRAINQFRINTAGAGKYYIIPDIVLFVNGIPLGVVECKDQNEFTSNALREGIKQIHRYSNQRESTREAGLKEGSEELFWYNQICIVSTGYEAKYGTITSTEQYFFHWKDIYPDKYKDYTPPLGKERAQERLIQGMLPPDTFLDIIRHFTLFMEVAKGVEIKILPRYQQYRAVGKIIKKLQYGNTPDERSGVVWHTQGSGKSLTMVMLVRKLRSYPELARFKVLGINDRTDLEEQLGETMELTGEKINKVSRISELREKLSTPSSNVVMVMIHKFQTKDTVSQSINGEGELSMVAEEIPVYTKFGEVNKSEDVLILIDEAHRTQSSDLGDNLFEAFPNATKIAFTGTPLITDRHKKKTHDRFGSYIDKYKLQDAVDDGATIQILYEGKTTDNAVKDKHDFDTKFEDLFKEHTKEEIEVIKQKYGTYGDVLEAESRIKAVAEDIVNHYTTQILPNGFKAQVVASSVLAAVRYTNFLKEAIADRLEKEKVAITPDEDLIKKLEFLKVYTVVSSQGTNEDLHITVARREAKEANAIDNFKKPFNFDKPETGIAFLVVVDMLLTGFDAPIEQVLYVDKKMKEHNLLQAIARVNRTYKGKSRGYVVDYIGISNHLKDALSIYGSDDVQDILDSFKDVQSEIPVLEDRYKRLLALFRDNGISKIEVWVNQKIASSEEQFNVLEACVELGKDEKFRADFDVLFKNFMISMDVVLPRPAADPYKIPAKRFGYLYAKTKQRYKDETLSVDGAGEKIKKLINEHLVSLGINPKIPVVELYSKDFIQEVNKNTSSKAIASEMEHAIRKHIKVSFEDDPALYQNLSEKLEAILKQHQEDWDQLALALEKLRNETLEGRKEGEDGMSKIESPFYDLIIQRAFKDAEVTGDTKEQVKTLTVEIMEKLSGTIDIIDFWRKGHEIKRVSGEVEELLLFTGIPEIYLKQEQIASDVMDLAKRRNEELVKYGKDK
jgi:type I restriction enzyme R subunit